MKDYKTSPYPNCKLNNNNNNKIGNNNMFEHLFDNPQTKLAKVKKSLNIN